jgi:hypothetical protein
MSVRRLADYRFERANSDLTCVIPSMPGDPKVKVTRKKACSIHSKGHCMNKLMAILLAATFAGATLAADVAEPETPGSEGPKAAAEAKHLAKTHGLVIDPNQLEAQASGSPRSQADAEAIHLVRPHGSVNDSADKRLEIDHPNH